MVVRRKGICIGMLLCFIHDTNELKCSNDMNELITTILRPYRSDLINLSVILLKYSVFINV